MEKLHTYIITKNGLSLGRLLSYSKSTYRTIYPDNKVIFNANIITSEGKVWHGDVDVTADIETLTTISNEINEPLYILYEMDCRFENENDAVEDLINKSRYIVNQRGDILEGNKFKNI